MRAPGNCGNSQVTVLDLFCGWRASWHTGCNVVINGRRLYVRAEGGNTAFQRRRRLQLVTPSRILWPAAYFFPTLIFGPDFLAPARLCIGRPFGILAFVRKARREPRQ